jgi:hypothetical protein
LDLLVIMTRNVQKIVLIRKDTEQQ